jgi:hypothetical protein
VRSAAAWAARVELGWRHPPPSWLLTDDGLIGIKKRTFNDLAKVDFEHIQSQFEAGSKHMK